MARTEADLKNDLEKEFGTRSRNPADSYGPGRKRARRGRTAGGHSPQSTHVIRRGYAKTSRKNTTTAGVGLDWNGEQVTEIMVQAGWEAILECAEDLLGKAQTLCPKDRGWDGGLVTSGRVEADEEILWADVKFGGPGFMHASLQHEKMNYNHAVGEAKYLETPHRENFPSYLNKIAAAIKRVVGS